MCVFVRADSWKLCEYVVSKTWRLCSILGGKAETESGNLLISPKHECMRKYGWSRDEGEGIGSSRTLSSECSP